MRFGAGNELQPRGSLESAAAAAATATATAFARLTQTPTAAATASALATPAQGSAPSLAALRSELQGAR